MTTPGGLPASARDLAGAAEPEGLLTSDQFPASPLPSIDAAGGADDVPHGAAAALPARSRYINRELSWLEFNARVLALAELPDSPVLERAKFLAIFSRNLDEFFQVRVAGLKEQVAAGLPHSSPDGSSPSTVLRAIRARVDELARRQEHAFREIARELEHAGVRFSNWDELDEDDRRHLDEIFEARIFPVLTPLAVDPAHPFPYISNLSLNLAVQARDPEDRRLRVARVKLPPNLPRFVAMPDGERVVPLEQVIAVHLPRLFPGMKVLAHHPFRLTRDADFEVDDDEADDLLEAVQSALRRRRRSPLAVRLEVDGTMSAEVLDLIVRELGIEAVDVYVSEVPLDLGGLWDLLKLDRPELKDTPWTPATPPQLAANPDIFRVIRSAPLLVHHPYEAFETSVEAFIDQAAVDPQVLAIKMSLYRTSPTGRIIKSLTRAAEAGKQVVALIELTARWDEQANIKWARVLEKAGVHVVYGMVGYKTHGKVTLVVRQESDGVHRYCHLGTGNYNGDTARTYEDLGFFTDDPAVGGDLSELFNALTGYSREYNYRILVVAPMRLRQSLREHIGAQSHPGGRIVLKANSLADQEIIELLYAASGAGAEIDLLIRGICCLRAGVPGLSERIRVRSLVGRYLEHSRIYRFGTPGVDATFLIGSADLMPRNLDRRVEVMVPITTPELCARLDEILAWELADEMLAWTLGADDGWSKVPTGAGMNAQRALMEGALARMHDGT